MLDTEKTALRAAYRYGAALGIYQAHALAGPPLAIVALLATPYWWLALMLAAGSAVGWAGWWRDYRLQWRPRVLPPAMPATQPRPNPSAEEASE